MNGKGYKVHIITYCTNCVFYVHVWGSRIKKDREKVEGWLERRRKCCACDESDQRAWRRLTEVCACLQIKSECNLPNLTLSLNWNESFHRCTRKMFMIKTQTSVSFSPDSSGWWTATDHQNHTKEKGKKEMAEVKRDQADLCQHKYNFGMCQHARLAFWWHWNITRAGA